ncbi:MAG: ABC transporter ATP-binding protein [Isosphaeraceae bacterium]
MTEPIIQVSGLSKTYRINTDVDRGYGTFRELIMKGMSACWRTAVASARGSRGPSGSPDGRGRPGVFRALDDVSFDVNAGEVVGVIGRNGAGKSTLLKVLSRIVEPSEGRVTLLGRVGSLLEVGTGFHPELTGRENVFLNAAILGMSRREATRKLDEIVAFAEIERFLDTPVKRYSSGMYMRLAFSVAAHLEPEILIVDEVLAVGDAAFQKKCLGKMSQVSRDGRTVLFVSHSMPAIKSLCSRAILMEGGRIAMDGEVDRTVDRYMKGEGTFRRNGVIPADTPRHQDVRDEARLLSVSLRDPDGKETTQLYLGQHFRVTFVCDILRDIPDGHFEVSISTIDGTHVTYSTTMHQGPLFLRRGRYEVIADVENALLPREYTIDLGVHHQNGATADFVQRALDFTVLRVRETGIDHYPWPRTRGLTTADARWSWSDKPVELPSPYAESYELSCEGR